MKKKETATVESLWKELEELDKLFHDAENFDLDVVDIEKGGLKEMTKEQQKWCYKHMFKALHIGHSAVSVCCGKYKK